MAGFHRDLRENYSVETFEGFARLSRMADREERWPPAESGNVDDDIMVDAVYGGLADPSQPREYAVYSVEWFDETPGDESEGDRSARFEQTGASDEAPMAEQVSGEPVEEFTNYLDENFPGWVYRKKHDEVYVLAESGDD